MRDVHLWAAASLCGAFLLAAWFRPDAGPSPSPIADLLFLERALVFAAVAAGAAVDVRRSIVPNAVPAAIVLLHAAFLLANSLNGNADAVAGLASACAGALAVGGGLLAFTLAYEAATEPGAFGGGDIKLLAALAFAFGWERAALLLAGACAVFALQMLARGQMRGRAPFVPAIAIATLATAAAA